MDALRLKQFGQFSASVEVGLQEYDTKEGPGLLLSSLLDRYGNDEIKREPLKPSEEEKVRVELDGVVYAGFVQQGEVFIEGEEFGPFGKRVEDLVKAKRSSIRILPP